MNRNRVTDGRPREMEQPTDMRTCMTGIQSRNLARIFVALAFCAAVPVRAQMPGPAPVVPYESDILAARPIRTYIGLALGVFAFQHQGSFSPSCDCEYGGERGTRVLAGPEFSVHYPKAGIALKGMILYRDVSATFMQRFSRRPSIVVGPDPDVLLDYERWSNVKLAYIDIMPSVAWYPIRFPVFLAGGIDLAIPVSSAYDNNERIISEGYAYVDGTRQTVLFRESDIEGGGSPRLDIHVSTGIDLYLSDHVYLTPQAGLILPLGAVSSKDPDWKVFTEYAVLVLKYRF